MKKKLTIGVFLALAVVLVASIVGVGVADAARPHTVSAIVTYECNGDDTVDVTINASWEKYAPAKIYWWLGNSSTNSFVMMDFGFIPLEGRITSYNEAVHTEFNVPAGQNYRGDIQLLAKNGRTLKGANVNVVINADCQ